MHRRELLIGSLALVMAGPAAAVAAGVQPFDAKAFAAAQDTGQGVVVYVHAPW